MPYRRKRNLHVRRGLLLAFVLSCVAAMAVTAFRYHRWKSERLEKLAASSLLENDYATAAMEARAALHADPQNDDARDLLAEAYEASNDPRVLDTLAAIPGEASAFRRARAALQLGNAEAAESALAAMQPGSIVDAIDYHALAAAVAAERSDAAQLYQHCLELATLAPDDTFNLIRLAYLAVLLPDQELPEAPLRELQRLATLDDGPEAADASVMALALALQSPGQSEAPRFAAILENHLDRSSELRASFLRALEFSPAPVRGSLLAALQRLCTRADQPEATVQVVKWMMQRRLHGEIVAWLNASPETFRIRDRVGERQHVAVVTRMLVTDAACQTGNWSTVKSLLENEPQWHDFQFLWHAYHARAAHMTTAGFTVADTEEYVHRAIVTALPDCRKLEMLEHLARAHAWDRERAAILDEIARSAPDKKLQSTAKQHLLSLRSSARGVK